MRYKQPPVKLPELKVRIEKAIGDGVHIKEWSVDNRSVSFRTSDITLNKLQAISNELGTEEINFNFGFSPEPGYSEYTPSSDGGPGYIEVLLANIRAEGWKEAEEEIAMNAALRDNCPLCKGNGCEDCVL